jgi:hypothetical protein
MKNEEKNDMLFIQIYFCIKTKPTEYMEDKREKEYQECIKYIERMRYEARSSECTFIDMVNGYETSAIQYRKKIKKLEEELAGLRKGLSDVDVYTCALTGVKYRRKLVTPPVYEIIPVEGQSVIQRQTCNDLFIEEKE